MRAPHFSNAGLKVFAYCTLPARWAVARATGVKPITSPPVLAGDFQPEWLEGYDLLYFRLHGLKWARGVWFGEDERGNHVPALEKRHLDVVDLSGAVVILANCYGFTSPMVREFYEAGARTVIAGPGPNMAAGWRVIGTDKLTRSIITCMKRGWAIERALQWAKAQLVTTIWRAADRDALEFEIM